MILLAIETSCDETAIALVKRRRGKQLSFDVLSHKVLSQATLHAEYGGVFPTLAKREHAKALPQLIAHALEEADLLFERVQEKPIGMAKREKLTSILFREPELLRALTVLFQGIQKPTVDAIAVTVGPGLPPALYIGANVAEALSLIWDIPLYPINHMEAHIIVGLLEKDAQKSSTGYKLQEPKRPAIALLISGGHTELVRITGARSYHILGETKDDAVGEAFDKVARLFGLPYPGGPMISKLAEKARNENVIPDKVFVLPRPMLHTKDLHFSMSGLKTSVLTKVKAHEPLSEKQKEMLAFEFENAVTDVLVHKTKNALYETRAQSLIIGGGVSANKHIREALKDLALEEKCDIYLPLSNLAGDNGIMIAATGLYHIHTGVKPKRTLTVNGNWRINTA